MAANTIILKGSPRGVYEEVNAAAVIKPGHVGIKDSSGNLKKNDVAGADTIPYCVRELGAFSGKTITDAYAQNDVVLTYIPEPGDRMYLRIPANQAAIAIGVLLKLDATGCLTIQGGTGKGMFIAEEAVDNSAVGAEAFITVRRL